MKRLTFLFLGLSFCVFCSFPILAEEAADQAAPEAVAASPAAPTASTDKSAEETSTKVPEPSASATAVADPQPVPQIKKTVVAVDVRGNRIVSTNTILSKIQTKQGLSLKQQTVNEDIKRLYATGFFEDVKLEVEELPEGYKLIVEVDEKPIVKQVVLEGATSFKEDKLRKTLGVIEGQILDRKAVKKGEEEIRKLYADKGFRFVDLQATVNVDSQTKEAVITIKVFEGKKFKITKISFEGVHAFKPKQLSKLMKTKAKIWFLFGTFKEGIHFAGQRPLRKIFRRKKGHTLFIQKQNNDPLVCRLMPDHLRVAIAANDMPLHRVGSVLFPCATAIIAVGNALSKLCIFG